MGNVCNVPNAATSTCVAGSCFASTCQWGFSLIGGTCVKNIDTNIDVRLSLPLSLSPSLPLSLSPSLPLSLSPSLPVSLLLSPSLPPSSSLPPSLPPPLPLELPLSSHALDEDLTLSSSRCGTAAPSATCAQRGGSTATARPAPTASASRRAASPASPSTTPRASVGTLPRTPSTGASSSFAPFPLRTTSLEKRGPCTRLTPAPCPPRSQRQGRQCLQRPQRCDHDVRSGRVLR